MAYREVLAEPGSRVVMLGNVATARGALEYGVSYASAYPGTPSTEITEALSYASRIIGAPYVEWSSNEKVALEGAIGAALSGVPAMASMKHVGVNVAADPLFSVAYMGVPAPLVVVSADDPGMWSSQNEQDNRWYGVHAYIPVVEPAGAQEARRAIIEAFRLSEIWEHPVMFRSTTRIGHTRVPVEVGDIDVEKLARRGRFRRNPERYTLVPAHARRLREELVEKWERMAEELSRHPLNTVEGDGGDLTIIASGLAYRYVVEAVRLLGVGDRVRIVKLGTPVPLPRRLVLSEMESAERVLFVEEGDPVVETLAKSEYLDNAPASLPRIYGKARGPVKRTGELTFNTVAGAIARILGVESPIPVEVDRRPPLAIPPRPPVLCPGCPYRAVFYALRRAVARAKVKPIWSGDIGCYSLGLLPPLRTVDTIVEMGGSIGLANGMSHVVEGQVPIAIIGDSTFFHSGLPGLANAVYNKAPILVVVLDNRTTAMTGHQPHPGVGVMATGQMGVELSIEDAARGLGVAYVKTIDAFNIAEGEEEFYRALEWVKKHRMPAVVVARGACILLALANARKLGVSYPVYTVQEERCTACGLCYKAFNCPAIYADKNGKARINELLCTGCGECAQICPFNAFKPVEEPKPEWLRLMRTAKPS